MRVLVAMNAFKECLSAQAASEAVANGVLRARSSSKMHVQTLPLADGGDGTAAVLGALPSSSVLTMRQQIQGPLPRSPNLFDATIVRLGNDRGVLIETAASNGLALLAQDDPLRSPCFTSTYGCANLVTAALVESPHTVWMSVGGSATNDAGCGLAAGLGFAFYDAAGNRIDAQDVTGAMLERVSRIEPPPLNDEFERLNSCQFIVLCDVDTRFVEATQAFARQKGARESDLQCLERGLENIARVLGRSQWCRCSELELLRLPGGGAAGALAGGLAAFLNAKLTPGFDAVAEMIGLEAAILDADLVITGEGKIDATTLAGKVPYGVAMLSKKLGRKCVALAGAVDRRQENAEALYRAGLTATFAISDRPLTLKESVEEAPHLLADTAQQIIQVLVD